MFNFFKDIDLLKSSKIAGLELFVSESGLLISVSVLEKKKGKIQLLATHEKLNVEQFAAAIDKNMPLYLSVDGKGVLHKSVGFTGDDSSAALLAKVLPGADESSFYVQGVSASFVSVVRREILDAVLLELTTLGYYIVGAALGPFALEKVATLIENKVVNTSNYIVKLNEGKLLSFERKENALALKANIGGEQVAEANVLSFVSALLYFISEDTFFTSDSLHKSKKEFREKRKFAVHGTSILLFFFVLLFVNYLVYDALKSGNSDLQAQFSLQSENFKISEVLKSELEAKRSLKEKLGVNGVTRISYYLDRIAATLPAQIQLTALAVNPVEKKIKADKEIEYEVNHIVIAGKCKKSIYYNAWKQELARMDWVRNISVVNYVDADDEVGAFVLKLEY